MTSHPTLTDRSIASLRRQHDQLAALVPTLTDDQLTGPSGASDWQVAQVLSHLGSGAEIGLAGYRAAVEGAQRPGDGFNQDVWDTWNARTPREQAEAFLEADEDAVAFLEGLSAEQRESVTVDLGFLPAPVSLTTVVGMRLNEVTSHSWDARVGVDPAAEFDAEGAALVLEHFTGPLGFLLGWSGKADRLETPAVVAVEGTESAIAVTDDVRVLRGHSGATATLTGGAEAAVRLLGGRLREEHAPAHVRVTGNVSLDDLRKVFPGY